MVWYGMVWYGIVEFNVPFDNSIGHFGDGALEGTENINTGKEKT